jgi:hypothetical protein
MHRSGGMLLPCSGTLEKSSGVRVVAGAACVTGRPDRDRITLEGGDPRGVKSPRGNGTDAPPTDR